MEPNQIYFNERKLKAEKIYSANATIFNPYFQKQIVLNSDGFHHLQFSARRERDKREQLLKFSLLPLALEIIKKSGTVQEYRKLLTPIGKKSARDGAVQMKNVEYWGLIAIVGEHSIKIKTILRRVRSNITKLNNIAPTLELGNPIALRNKLGI